MPFNHPTMADTRAFLAAFGKALFPGLNFDSERSYHGKRVTFTSGAVTQLHAHALSAGRDAHPLTAGPGQPIRDWGTTVGVGPKAATPARKADAARVRGDSAEVANAGEIMVHDETGLTFQLNQLVTIPGVLGDGNSSFVDADIVAVDVGAQTRLKAGSVLRFLSLIPGIESTVVLQRDLDEDGLDEEQFGSHRARVLSTFSSAPSGGNQADFVKWTLEAAPSIAKAFCYPNRAGRGSVDIVAFYAGSGTARSLTLADRDAVKAYIQTLAPLQISGDAGDLRVLSTVATSQRVEILLDTNGIPAFAFDWEDGGAPLVASWTAATRELQFNAALPISLRAGHRLALDGAAQDGREFRIEALSAADKVILEAAPQNVPIAGDKIYSGGPLVTPIRDAISAHLDGQIVYSGRGGVPLAESAVSSPLGLNELAQGVGPANPAGIYGTWSGGVLRAILFQIAMSKAGVRNATIVSPAVDVDAVDDAFPSDAQIHYIAPGMVLIRST